MRNTLPDPALAATAHTSLPPPPHRYNRLYTVTAQCDESDVKKYKGMLEAIIKTFKSDVAAKSA